MTAGPAPEAALHPPNLSTFCPECARNFRHYFSPLEKNFLTHRRSQVGGPRIFSGVGGQKRHSGGRRSAAGWGSLERGGVEPRRQVLAWSSGSNDRVPQGQRASSGGNAGSSGLVVVTSTPAG